MTEQIHPEGYLADAFALAYPETAPFWQAAAQQRLLLKGCGDCGRHHWYPRVVCPLCGSGNTGWSEASGRGTIYSYSVVERADPPYVVAWVELAEGPVLVTNIVDCDPASVAIGDAVRVRFEPSADGRAMPVFAPA